MKILVVGMGLIGGSFCKAIKKYTAHHMIGMDSDEATLEMAIAMESVDEIIPVDRPHLMKRADLTIVALPPHKIVDFILENKNNFAQGAIVTDVCGVKKYIVESLEAPLAEAGVSFIGSHPMAGTEFSGFSFSLADMFVNASYLITPTGRSDRAHVDILRSASRQSSKPHRSVTMKVSPIPLSWPTWFQIHISKARPSQKKEVSARAAFWI